jgi:hypothetical protein
MKNILMILLIGFTSLSAFSQSTERAEKINKVNEKNSSSQTSPPQQVIVQPTPTYNNYNPYYSPYRNPYRRNRYRYSNPYSRSVTPIVYDSRPTRTYNDYEPMVSVGFINEISGRTPTISPYLTIGQQTFLMLQYHWGGRNTFPYYDNIETWEVIQWQDEPMGNPRQRKEFVIGLGSSVDRFSPFIGIGIGSTTQWDAYFDETYTLSSPRDLGIYTINKDRDSHTSLKLGTKYHWDRWELISQISFWEGLSFGDGLRLGVGVGLKL